MFRIPPILVETISVSLVVYKATHYLRAPKTQGGSRFMDCILRYSVLYFVASVPAAPVLLPYLIHVNYSVLSVYVANLYVWATQKVTTRITILIRDADTCNHQVFVFELFIPLTFALPSVVHNRMLLSLRAVAYGDHDALPRKYSMGVDSEVMNPARGLTIAIRNPLKQLQSVFEENNTA